MKIFEAAEFYLGLGLKSLAYAVFLHLWFHHRVWKSVGVGTLRALIGALVGAALLYEIPSANHSSWPFYACLLLARIFEWYGISFLMDENRNSSKRIRFVASATALSVVLDLLVIAGWISTGAGIC